MQPAPTAAHLQVIAQQLGEPVAIEDVDDAKLRANVARLRREQVSVVRISTLSAIDLAVAVTPGAPGGPPAVEPFDAVVVCTESSGADASSEWTREYRRRAGLAGTAASLVGGAACANFALGLDVCRAQILAGVAQRLLLVVVDRVLAGTRYTPVSQSVYGDGAVACLVTADASPGAFRVVGSATVSRLAPCDETNLAEARRTVVSMSEAVRLATRGQSLERLRHIVTLNLGDTARRLVAMAAPPSPARLYSDLSASNGHCLGADIALNLQGLAASAQLADEDLVLALTCGRHDFSAISLAYVGA